VHPLMSFPCLNSQRNEHADDTRAALCLRPPFSGVTGRNREGGQRHHLPLAPAPLVQPFVITRSLCIAINDRLQCASPATSPEP
jgi:hypothetical protein